MKRFLLLFLMASFLCNLYAMEENKGLIEPTQSQLQTALTIIDSNGKEFILSPKHYEQALKCLAIKNMTNDSDNTARYASPRLAVSGSQLATHVNIERLFDLMAGDIQLEQLSEQEVITLFKLADYLEASSILPLLAQKVYMIASRYPINHPDRENLLALAASCFAEYGSCGQFLETSGRKILNKIYDADNGILNFSYEAINKKINSFNGIEKIIDLGLCNPNLVRIIDMRNQNITNFKVFDLFRIFPNLKQLYLSNNKITQITYDQLLGTPQGFKLYLDKNPISLIESQCFTNFSRFKQSIIFLQGTNLSLEQEQEAFTNNHIQARLHPQGWRARLTRLSYYAPIAMGIAITGLCLGSVWLENFRGPAVLVDLLMKNKITWDQFAERGGLRSQSLPTMAIKLMIGTYLGPYMTLFGILERRGNLNLPPFLIGDFDVPAFLQVRNPYHLFVKTDRGNYNFPTVYHL